MLSGGKPPIVFGFGIVALMICMPFLLGEYYLYLILLVAIYSLLTLGLNIYMGYAGQINLGSAAFFCIGAYASTILQLKLGWHFLISFPVAVLITLLVAWGISYPLLRLRGHAAAIGTVGFALVVFLVAERFPELTGGQDGVSVPSVIFFGHSMGGVFYYYGTLSLTVAGYLFCYLLVNSRIGRAFKAVRDNEDAAAAMGVDIHYFKVLAWLVSAGFGGIAGVSYAQQAGFLSPATFSLWTNVVVLVMICVGGLGSNLGSVVGAAIMTLLPFLISGMKEYVLLTQGLVLFLVLRFLPGGIVGAVAQLLRRWEKAE